MPKTRLELANRSLFKLGIVGVGQSPEAEDTQAINGIIENALGDLEARRIFSVADLDAIDDAPFEWLADYLAYIFAPDKGIPRDDEVRKRAEYMLRMQSSTDPTFQALTVDYF